jgi:hypothetical protein
MTRLEILQSYADNRIRDTYVSMGQPVIDNTTRVYLQYTLYRITEATAPLNGAYVYCDVDYTVPADFDWNDFILVDPTLATTGQIINQTTNIINPHFTILLTLARITAIPEPYDPTFIPFQEPDATALLSIDDDDLNTILIEAGVPFIALQELEYNRDQILNYMIWPAVKEYYRWFPIMSVERYPLADSHFEIPIPPKPVFTALRAYLNPGYPISNVQGNPLARYFDEVLMSISPRGAFSTPNLNSSRRQGFVDTQSYATYILERAARQGIINYGSRTRIRIFQQAGYIRGYSTKRGILEIEWGSYSQEWNDIPMNRQPEVRDLAKANVLRNFASLRMQANSTIPGTINYDYFITRADELEKRVIALWQESLKAVIIRS